MADEVKNKFHARTIGLIGFSHMSHDIYTAFLPPLLPLLIDKFGLSYALAGSLIFLVRAPSIISPFIGIFADRIGPKYFIIIAPAATAATMSFIGYAPSFYFLCGLLLLAGVSSAIYHVPAPAAIRRIAGDKIGTGMSFFMLGGELARTLGPIIILGAVSIWGLEGTYRTMFLGIGVSLVLYWRLRKFNLKNEEAARKSVNGLKVVLKRLKPVFIIAGALVVSKSFMILALTSFLPTYLTSKGASLWLAGASLSIIEIAGAGGAFASGSISDIIGRRKMLLIVSLIAPVIMVLFVYADGWVLFPILIILGLMVFAYSPVAMAYVMDSEKEYPASANSVFMTLNFMSGSIVVLLIGFLGDLISLDYTYIISAALSLVGVPFILKMPKDGKKA